MRVQDIDFFMSTITLHLHTVSNVLRACRINRFTMSGTYKNILLLIADDLGKYVGCYGCTSTSTPNIDALAADGVRFDMAFASTASCSGSRSTIYTGLHTHENGQYGLNIFR
jgi:hypothetical protein